MTFQPFASLPPLPLDALGAWMQRQRWFTNKGSAPALEEIGRVDLPSDEAGVSSAIHLLIDHAAEVSVLYQVPLTSRRDSTDGSGDEITDVGGQHRYDGPHDPAFTRGLLELITAERKLDGHGMTARGRRAPGELAIGVGATAMVSHVLSGEQSNTSIIFEPADQQGTPVICKLFRVLHSGENPDVVLQSAIADAGSIAVPRSIGHITAEWNDNGEPTMRAIGHLAFAQEFLPGARDGWRFALAAAGDGVDFSADARALGLATAGVHATLARALPTRPASPDDITTMLALMESRLAAATTAVPELGELVPALREMLSVIGRVAWPTQQRIHGDLHLGQALTIVGRGWVIVDFEGEPMRPLRERSGLDSPLRDIAGMLRSFDYVAGSIEVAGAAAPPAGWVSAARTAFEDGYAAGSGRDLTADRALLDAFELDKALYETIYEARNRPDWLRIPVAGIERLVARARN